jgi:plastocyanin
MTISRRLLALASATLAMALVALPAIAAETTPTVNALGGEEYGLGYKYPAYWSPTEVKVEPGGHVTFANASATVKHGIIWTGAAPACEQGVPVGEGKATTSWSGSCTFTQAGEYKFYCSFHGKTMSGTITVGAGGAVTPGPGSSSPEVPAYPPSGSGGSGAQGAPGQGGSPLVGGSHALKLKSVQHGGSVHGTVEVSPAGAGGALEVAVFASRASPASTRRPAGVRVGRIRRSAVHTGAVPFTVALTARGRSALRRRHRLALTLEVVLTPVAGSPAVVTRSVVLRG